MCIRYYIMYDCGHVIPLDPVPTLCLRAVLTPHVFPRPPCRPVLQQGIPSDDVCPGCAAVFAGFLERAMDRQRRRREGEVVEGVDIAFDERGRALLHRWIEKTRWMELMTWFGVAFASVA